MSNPYATPLPAAPDLAQQRRRAKELLKALRAGDKEAIARLRYGHPRLANAAETELQAVKLHDAQWVIAREYGFSSWIRLKRHIDEIAGLRRRPYRIFETDLDYYRRRAGGLLSALQTGEHNALRLVRQFHPQYANATDAEIEASSITQEDAELIQAREHGFDSWEELVAAVEALKTDPSREPFRLAFEAIEANDDAKLAELLEQHASLAKASGTNGNQLLHFAVNHDNPKLVTLALEAGADPDAANDKGSTPLTQAAYRGKGDMIELLLAEGASVDAEAYGDGGTPLAFALFWGHREAAETLAEVAVVPRNLRIAAGLGRIDIMLELFDTDGALKPEAGFHREFHRPHSGFPPWRPHDDHQEVLDEALNYAARSGRIEAMSFLHARGADLDSAPYQATPLVQAVLNGHLDAIEWLLDHGADIDKKSGYGEPRSATPLHFAAAWGGQLEAAKLLVARGADLAVKDDDYNAPASGWANHFGHEEIEAFLLDAAKAVSGMAQTRYSVRRSDSHDLAAVTELLEASYPVLMKAAYEPAVLDPALKLMTRAKPALLSSGTYYVAELADGSLVGCGGWTREPPDDHVIQQGVGHIRHFAVHPDWIRRGVGSAIYRRCEADARAAGIRKLECYASLNAEAFYSALGFKRIAIVDTRMAPDVSLTSCHMYRRL